MTNPPAGGGVFTVAGTLGLIATVLAWNSGQYRRLSETYLKGARA